MRVKALVIAAAALSLSAGSGHANARPQTETFPHATAASGGTYLADDGLHASRRPRSLRVGNQEILRRLRWRHWGDAAAYASGRSVANDCQPSCYDGGKVHYPVTAKAVRLFDCRGHRIYLQVELTYTLPGGKTYESTYRPPSCSSLTF